MDEKPAIDAPTRWRSRALIWPFVVFCGLTLLFALALKSGDPTRLPSALIGKPVPDLALAPLPGLAESTGPIPGFSGADLRQGQASIVNFWASWCGPCVQEHPLLVTAKNETGARVLGVNYKDQPAAARHFLEQHGNPYAAVGIDGSGRAAIEWGVYGIPETFIVDGEGRIVFRHVGPITPQTLRTILIPALERARAPTR